MKLIRGNPGKRKLNKDEPKPKVALPHCPDYLDDVARGEWDRLAPILVRMKVLTEADYIALASLCQTYSTMMKAQEQLNKSGILFKTPSGYVQKIVMLCREFGLTPSARSRVQANSSDDAKQQTPWDRVARR